VMAGQGDETAAGTTGAGNMGASHADREQVIRLSDIQEREHGESTLELTRLGPAGLETLDTLINQPRTRPGPPGGPGVGCDAG